MGVWVRGWRACAACGLVIGWLAAMLAPLGANNAAAPLAGGVMGPARASFFLALALAALAACEPRAARVVSSRGFAFAMAGTSCALGLANWALGMLWHEPPVLLACTFATSGALAFALQLAVARGIVGTGGGAGRREVGVILVASVAAYALIALAPAPIRRPIDSLAPLAALALMPQARATGTSAPAPADVRPGHAESARQLAAVALAMTAGCVFNGMAEANAFVLPAVMLLGTLLGVAGGAWAARAARLTPACGDRIMAGCVLAIATSTCVQGLMTLGGMGQELLDRGFASAFHVAVFVSEYVLLGLVLTSPSPGTRASASTQAGSKPPAPTGLCCANAGMAAGTLLGMLLNNGAAATMVSLALALVAALLLGLTLGGERTTPANAPSPTGAPAEALESLARTSGLSQREADVLALWAAGHQIDYVAEQLCISRNTAKTHVRHIYAKVGVTSREELLQRLERK